jgi:hypothetical protein
MLEVGAQVAKVKELGEKKKPTADGLYSRP